MAQKSTASANRPTDKKMNSRKKEAAAVECIFCTELYTDPPIDDWIMCSNCDRWCHEACADTDKHNAAGAFICGEC